MRETIQNYFEKTKQYPNYYSNEDFSIICDDIKKEIDAGVFFVKRKNMDIDGEGEDKPIANSLKELINNMNVNPNIRKKEENKCYL